MKYSILLRCENQVSTKMFNGNTAAGVVASSVPQLRLFSTEHPLDSFCSASSSATPSTSFSGIGEIVQMESHPHPRSAFAVYRRVSDRVCSKEGSCSRRLLHQKHILSRSVMDKEGCSSSDRVACVCSAMMLQASETTLGCLVPGTIDKMVAVVFLTDSCTKQNATLDSVSPMLAQWRLQHKVLTTSFSLVLLCSPWNSFAAPDKLLQQETTHEQKAPADSSVEMLVQLFLSSEESEVARDLCIVLEDDALGSSREVSKLSTILSLRVLHVVSNARFLQHGDNTSTASVEGSVQSSVYEAVLKNVVARKKVVSPSSGGIRSSFSCVDLALAHKYRFSNITAYTSFLLEVCEFVADEYQTSSVNVLALEMLTALAREQLTTMNKLGDVYSWIRSVSRILDLNTNCSANAGANQSGLVHVLASYFLRFKTLCNDGISSATHTETMLLLEESLCWLLSWKAQQLPPSWLQPAAMRLALDEATDATLGVLVNDKPTLILDVLLKSNLMNPLLMDTVVHVTVPLVEQLKQDEFVLDFATAMITQIESVFTGGLHGVERVCPVVAAAVKRRAAAKGVDESVALDQILTGLAEFGQWLFRSSREVDVETAESSGALPRKSYETIDPDAAFLGGPFEFAKFIVSTGDHIWKDTQKLFQKSSQESDDGERCPAAEPSAPIAGGSKSSLHVVETSSSVVLSSATLGLVFPASLRQRYTVSLEQIIRAASAAQSTGAIANTSAMGGVLTNSSLARFIEKDITLPNVHDEYRRKLFLMVNVIDDKHRQEVPAELRKLTGALPLQFLQWASVSIARDVVVQSGGNNARFVHLLQTAVDLQLPPSTARSRIAGVLAVYKLIRSQRGKLSAEEYSVLLHRCLISLPLSYFLSSWTFFVWWIFVGCLVLLHFGGWSLEASYIADHCRGSFNKELQLLQQQPDGTVIQEQSVALSSPSVPSIADRLQGKMVLIVTNESRSSSQNSVMKSVVKDLIKGSSFVFCLRSGPGGLGYAMVTADDVIHDAAQRVRRASNTTRNPVKRLLFNLFPLHRPSAEESLLQMVSARAAAKGHPVTFVLQLPIGVELQRQELEHLESALLSSSPKSSLIILSSRCRDVSSCVPLFVSPKAVANDPRARIFVPIATNDPSGVQLLLRRALTSSASSSIETASLQDLNTSLKNLMALSQEDFSSPCWIVGEDVTPRDAHRVQKCLWSPDIIQSAIAVIRGEIDTRRLALDRVERDSRWVHLAIDLPGHKWFADHVRCALERAPRDPVVLTRRWIENATSQTITPACHVVRRWLSPVGAAYLSWVESATKSYRHIMAKTATVGHQN